MANDIAVTATQELIELKLGERLADFVAQRRNGRPVWSWQELANELADRTEVRVSREWLRVRFSDPVVCNCATPTPTYDGECGVCRRLMVTGDEAA